ncbi:MAG TPA: glycosyltransferase [Agriterribacter sp.]|nr:glycosyltransferase [Agriterribacter sp.]
MNVLWLASWYPNKVNPFEGDFIQRHAKSVSNYVNLVVVHVTQFGPSKNTSLATVELKEAENLKEYTIYFPFKKTGIFLLDKITYNVQYYWTFTRFIRKYFKEHGLPDIVHVHVPMKAGVIGKWIKQKWKIPYITTEHSSSYYDYIPDNYFVRSRYYRKAVSGILKKSAQVTTVSRVLAEQLKDIFALFDIQVIHNVVDTTIFFRQEVNPPVFRFFHASTMNHPKNVEGILNVFARLLNQRDNWECVMAGWETAELKKKAFSLGLENHIKWVGVLTYNEVATSMQASHALIMFSRYENFPCVVIEALCCGLPVIATNVGGIPEAVNHSNGLLVQSENEDGLLQAMTNMINNYDSFNRVKIADQASKKYSYEVIGKQFYDLYQKTLTQTTPTWF